MTRDVRVRPTTPDELPDVIGVLDAGALETDATRVRAAIDRGDVLVAVSESVADQSNDGTVVGALVLDGHEIANVAVRRRRRGQGIGTALVSAAADRVRASDGDADRLVAEFDASVRPFYESLGFETVPLDEPERYRGRKPADAG